MKFFQELENVFCVSDGRANGDAGMIRRDPHCGKSVLFRWLKPDLSYVQEVCGALDHSIRFF